MPALKCLKFHVAFINLTYFSLPAIPVPHVLLELHYDDIWEPQGLVGFSGSVKIDDKHCASLPSLLTCATTFLLDQSYHLLLVQQRKWLLLIFV